MSEDERNEYYRQVMDKLNNVCDDDVVESSSGDEEYKVAKNEINIDDYVPASTYNETADHEFKKYINIMNIFTYYYKQTFNITEKVTIFDDIPFDDKTATNKCMEFVYGEIFRFENSTALDKDVLYGPDDNIDIESYTELYCLIIDDEPKHIAPFIVILISHLETLDWLNINWKIINIL